MIIILLALILAAIVGGLSVHVITSVGGLIIAIIVILAALVIKKAKGR